MADLAMVFVTEAGEICVPCWIEHNSGFVELVASLNPRRKTVAPDTACDLCGQPAGREQAQADALELAHILHGRDRMAGRPQGVPEGYGPTGVLMTTGEEVYRSFTTFQTWVNKAQTWVRPGDACFDQLGRRCWNGGDMMRARDEGAFPVTIARKI